MPRRAPRVLFRAAAGPGQGFGHLMRCRALARALKVRFVVSLRGTSRTAIAARRLGCELWPGAARTLSTARFDLLVVDDPSPPAALAWITAARRRGVPSASVDMAGPAVAILDPSIARRRRRRVPRRPRTVLVTLGGGRHVRQRGHAVAAAILAREPRARVVIAQGFGPRPSRPAPAGATWLRTSRGLAGVLSTATVAVVAGGLTLYEGCALGTPMVVLPVVAAQRPAAHACARARAVRYVSETNPARAVAQAAAVVVSLLRAPSLRADLGRRASTLVDGRGATRVAAQLRALLARNVPEVRHAA